MPSIALTIATEDWDEYRLAFLAVYPVPLDPDTGEPTMTETQWVKDKIGQLAWEPYRLGMKRLRDREHPANADPDIIT
jgi:hypothetical protein